MCIPTLICIQHYACSDESIIGQRAEQLDIKVVRLTKSLLDLEKPHDVEQAIGQLEQMPGADVYVSLTCTYFSPLQHLNVAVHGNEFSKKLKQSRRKVAIKNHGRIAVEWPRSSGLWETKVAQLELVCFNLSIGVSNNFNIVFRLTSSCDVLFIISFSG